MQPPPPVNLEHFHRFAKKLSAPELLPSYPSTLKPKVSSSPNSQFICRVPYPGHAQKICLVSSLLSLPFDICDDTHCSLGMLMCNRHFSSRGLSSLWVGASSIAQTWGLRYPQRSELIAIALDVFLLYSSREGHRVSLPIVQGILSTLFS